MKMTGFARKVALITGSSSGIGASTAMEFVRRGARVFITGRSELRLEKVAEKCRMLASNDDQVAFVSSDLLTESGAELLTEKVMNTFGTVNILVNNAGSIYPEDGPISRQSVLALDKHYQLFVRSPWMLTALLKDEICKNKGAIVNVTSMGSSIVKEGGSAYCAMKAALEHLTRAMAVEFAARGVRVNAVGPGYVSTGILTSKGISEEESEEVLQELAGRAHLLQRALLSPEDVARAIIFLASSDASRITGTSLPVDGGCLLAHPVQNVW